MARVTHHYQDPDRFVCGTVGWPGDRVFYMQVRQANRLTTVRCDREQVDLLSGHLDRILNDLSRLAAGIVSIPDAVEEPDDTDPLDAPLEEEFTIGAIAISWDNPANRLVVEFFAVSGDEMMSADPQLLLYASPEDAPNSLEVRLTPDQARQFVARCRFLLKAGRPSCPFCGQPINPGGHICPRSNGYRRPLFL
ncbi:DUF3090 domain-containing protein [Acidipropionibacterium jensenii]|uniref:DUF3090 family protein n=1 Tax=Acidipropionibacterium jensenii TaxID=1749 RepID=UPI000BC2E22C|nr:DUF3090 family protein [Acidipropionibacterium jensenii]AZZ42370.1 DUF3090 domain-containing protein [Acidipropionibacterium jensenii]QCV88651.1 DUF3090 family protein [Acidipropionibacterium jensenii]